MDGRQMSMLAHQDNSLNTNTNPWKIIDMRILSKIKSTKINTHVCVCTPKSEQKVRTILDTDKILVCTTRGPIDYRFEVACYLLKAWLLCVLVPSKDFFRARDMIVVHRGSPSQHRSCPNKWSPAAPAAAPASFRCSKHRRIIS